MNVLVIALVVCVIVLGYWLWMLARKTESLIQEIFLLQEIIKRK